MKDLLDDVIPKIPIKEKKDRPKFIAVWLVAGLLILAYAIWLAIKVAGSYENPGAQIGVDPTQPPYPVFAVCFWQLDPNATVKVSALHTITKKTQSTYTGFEYSEFLPQDFEQDGETYSKCIQFNAGANATVKANKGTLELIVQAAYPSDTLHASVDLLVLPAGKGFSDDTDPETWDNIILATDSYVDARWTAQRKIDVNGKKTMRYQLVSQVEPLTHERKRSLTSTTEFIDGLPQCGQDDQQGDSCTVNGRTGTCRDSECQFECPDLTTIPLTYLCDFFNDCPGGEDEVGCPAGFDCAGDGSQFVPMSAKCNGIDDCDDSQDEENCDNYPLFVGATIQPYTQYVTVTEDYVSFGWESFFASLASGWSIIGVGIAFFFPEETATYLRWRGTKAKEEDEESGGKKEKEKEKAKPEAAEMKTLTSAPQTPVDESAKPDEEEV